MNVLRAGVIVYAVTLLAAVANGFGSPIMKLERAAHANNQNSGMSELLARDHARMLHKYGVEFPLEGSYDPDLSGLYYTIVHIGSPPREFYVLIDSGSDVSWISCSTCTSCPTATTLPIQLHFFDPENSSTASFISCSDESCTTIRAKTPRRNNMVDGIFGFGQSSLSIISQLFREGVAPNKFAHCLKGDRMGGGVLVLGQVVEPNIVYTPLVPSQPHYSIKLRSISINNQLLAIDPSVFMKSKNKGAVVDSGTSLAYLPEEAYNPFIGAITAVVSKSTESFLFGEIQCYASTSSDIFPRVVFNFVGGASLILSPQDYLLQQIFLDGSAGWCIGFGKSPDKKITILGDIILKDKIIVYDLEGQRLGWVNYNCSLPITVSRFHGRGQRSSTDRSRTILYGLLLISFMVIFMCTCN